MVGTVDRDGQEPAALGAGATVHHLVQDQAGQQEDEPRLDQPRAPLLAVVGAEVRRDLVGEIPESAWKQNAASVERNPRVARREPLDGAEHGGRGHEAERLGDDTPNSPLPSRSPCHDGLPRPRPSDRACTDYPRETTDRRLTLRFGSSSRTPTP